MFELVLCLSLIMFKLAVILIVILSPFVLASLILVAILAFFDKNNVFIPK